MASISLEHVDKVYPNGFVASHDLTLAIPDGEFLVLVGPSGSGKSTVLRMIAGLEAVSSGTVRIGARDVTALPPQERDIAMVFQSYALYPHMSVRENIGFGLRIRRVAPGEIERRVSEVASALGLEALLARRPAQLSGGQRQRVALGRAIAREPLAFLLDEPLSNLDAQLRVETRAELSRLHRRLGATMVYVTHDQVEAMTLGDRVAVLRDGVLQQVAPPMELYRRPANKFVGGFIGSPVMNLLTGTLRRDGERCLFQSPALSTTVACAAGGADESVLLGVRPQHVELGGPEHTAPDAARAEVTMIEPLGDQLVVHLTLDGGERIIATTPPDAPVTLGDAVTVRVSAGSAHLFRQRDGLRM